MGVYIGHLLASPQIRKLETLTHKIKIDHLKKNSSNTLFFQTHLKKNVLPVFCLCICITGCSTQRGQKRAADLALESQMVVGAGM